MNPNPPSAPWTLGQVHLIAQQAGRHLDYPACLRDMVRLPAQRAQQMDEAMRAFCFVIPKVGKILAKSGGIVSHFCVYSVFVRSS